MTQRRQAQVRPGDLGRRLGPHGVAPDVGHGHGGELGVALEEGLDLPLVLGRQHRAGGVDEAAARLHQARRGVEDGGLLGDELGEILGPQGPAAVGIATPGAGAGAGRVDQHAVEGAGLALQPFAVVAVERAALDIVGAGAAQTLGRAVEPALVDVHGDDAALVVHAGGDGQGLAARAGAVVGDLHAGLGVDQAGDELRALVLDLDQAALEGLARHDGQAALQPQTVGGKAHGLGVDALERERGLRLGDGGLQAVDAQVDGRRLLEGGDLAAPGLAVGLLEMRRHPLLDVQPHPVGLLGVAERMAFQLAQRAAFAVVERIGAVAAAVEHRLDVAEGHALDHHQVGGDDAARQGVGPVGGMAGAPEPPAQLAPAAQDAPHAIGHGAAVAAADVAAGAEVGVGDEVGRPLGLADDLVEKLYGGGNPRARRHVDFPFPSLPLR